MGLGVADFDGQAVNAGAGAVCDGGSSVCPDRTGDFADRSARCARREASTTGFEGQAGPVGVSRASQV